MGDALDQFRDALRGRGILAPDDLQADGALHRCDVDGGKRGKGDAAYLLHLDGIPAGGFKNWRDGLGWQAWKADTGRTFTAQERAAYRARMEAARRQHEADKAARHADAANRAAAIWAAAKPGPHAYRERKGIDAHGARVYKGALVIRVRDATGALTSLQFIAEDGDKKFLTGGRKEGCYGIIPGDTAGALCIAEGFATGASVREATGYGVAVAFDCNNLEPVARVLRDKLPAERLIICGDDDRDTEGNPGRTKAIAAARAVRGLVALPEFAEVPVFSEAAA